MCTRNSLFCFAAWLVVLSLVMAGCAPSQPVATEAPAKKIVIGLSLSTLDNPFFVSVRDGAQEAADRLDAELIVADAGNDSAAQQTQIEDFIAQKVDILLVNPVDSDAVGAAIQAANDAGVPVITLDRSANAGQVASHIASDNVAGGRMAANYLAEVLGKTGQVVELQGLAGTSAAQDRGAGFNEAIAAYDGIQVIAQAPADFDRAQGKEAFAALLKQYEDIDGVFAHNDQMILGAQEAAAEAGRADILFVGFDAIDEAVQAVEAGQITATVAQQPQEIGRLGVETAVKLLKGESVPAFIPVELALVHN
ncbi:MAG: D-ribose ABC transporter substrate-binding protein [Chloroflexota bacterium]